MDIEIVATLSTSMNNQDKIIHDTLSSEYYVLIHGGIYTGKPGTRIHANEHHVVKIHQEYTLNARDARRWIERKIQNEREYAIYHPNKTWFIIHQPDRSLIANITPKLCPLHQLEQGLTPEQQVTLLCKMTDMYMRIASKYDKKLDEGLSNFGVNDQNELFYLDDDIYHWDNFTSFCESLRIWFSRFDWLTPELALQLGMEVANVITHHFEDKNSIMILLEQVRSLFLVNTEQQIKRDGFLKGLTPKCKSKRVSPSFQNRYMAILADIHANYPALQAVLSEIKRLEITQGIILGDIVGYGPHPKECIASLIQSQFSIIKGNHDHAVSTGYINGGISSIAKTVIIWTQAVLDDNEKTWLAELPAYIQHDDWLAVHGAPIDKSFFNAYVYSRTAEDNLNNLVERNIKICFHGHSHIAGTYYLKKNIIDFCNAEHLPLYTYQHCLVCPGSVGQPRGGIPGAEFAIYDKETCKISLHRCQYDLETVLTDMRSNNFQNPIIERFINAT